MFILVLLALGVYGITVFANGSTTGVNVSGKLDITENGIYDISDKEYVDVDVAVPDNYVDPDGTKNIWYSGLFDVSQYEYIDVKCDGLQVSELPSTDIDIYSNYKIYHEKVPNTGYVDKVYFDINKYKNNIIELYKIFDTFSYVLIDNQLVCPLLVNEDLSKTIILIKSESQGSSTNFYFIALVNLLINDIEFIFNPFGYDEIEGSWNSYWNPKFSYEKGISIESNVMNYVSDLNCEVGIYNDLIKDLFYINHDDNLYRYKSLSDGSFYWQSFKEDRFKNNIGKVFYNSGFHYIETSDSGTADFTIPEHYIKINNEYIEIIYKLDNSWKYCRSYNTKLDTWNGSSFDTIDFLSSFAYVNVLYFMCQNDNYNFTINFIGMFPMLVYIDSYGNLLYDFNYHINNNLNFNVEGSRFLRNCSINDWNNLLDENQFPLEME